MGPMCSTAITAVNNLPVNIFLENENPLFLKIAQTQQKIEKLEKSTCKCCIFQGATYVTLIGVNYAVAFTGPFLLPVMIPVDVVFFIVGTAPILICTYRLYRAEN